MMNMEYPKYHAKVHVYTHDADGRGDIKTRRLSQLVSDVATLHTKELHVDRDTMLKDGITWMLRSIHMVIDKMPRAGEDMKVDTFPCGIERLFALRCYEMRSQADEMLVRVSSRWMQIDVARRRPIRPTAAIVALNDGLTMPADMPQGGLDSACMPADMNIVRRYVATYDNIDFNGHVTQSSYMMWMTDSLTYDFHYGHRLIEAEVVYEHEILPEAEVVAWMKIEENDGQTVVWHKLTSSDGTVAHCLGRTVWR